MKNIVVLLGSMRKEGNTDLLVQSFVKGASKNNSVEVISVADYNVNPCVGCNACFTSSRNECVQKDDMEKVYRKLSKADMIVIASPVYFYGISAKLKAVIDRLHNPLRNTFKVKELALLLVAADTKPKVFASIEMQYKLVLDYFKLNDAGRILVNGVCDKGDIKGNKSLDDAYELGMSIK